MVSFHTELKQVIGKMIEVVAKIGIPTTSITLKKDEILELRVATENVIIMVDQLVEREAIANTYKSMYELQKIRIGKYEEAYKQMEKQLNEAQKKLFDEQQKPTTYIQFKK